MKTTTTMLLTMVCALTTTACEQTGGPYVAACTATTAGSDCSEGETCIVEEGETEGYCAFACISDDQCASGSCDVETSRCDEIAPI